MQNNFDLKKFLTENKITTNSQKGPLPEDTTIPDEAIKKYIDSFAMDDTALVQDPWAWEDQDLEKKPQNYQSNTQELKWLLTIIVKD